jgi:hypothetical protein
MNELNQLEKELESWSPRGPSARLKQRLFPAVAVQRAEAAPHVSMWARLAPAVGVAMLAAMFSLAPHEKVGYLAVSGGPNALASLSSNLLGFCATNTRCMQVNTAAMPDSAITFEWTSDAPSLSTSGSFPVWKTNLHKL